MASQTHLQISISRQWSPVWSPPLPPAPAKATESRSRNNMFGVQQDRPLNFGGQGAGGGASSLRLHSNSLHRANRKDGNFNFLGQEDELLVGDENRNQVRPRLQTPQGRELFLGSALMSPLSRLPCWSPLEPLPEVEVGEDGCGRVPPEGAEGKMEEEEEEAAVARETEGRKGAKQDVDGGEEEEDEEDEEDEWDESGSEFGFSYRSSSSSSSSSSLSLEAGEDVGKAGLGTRWVGPPGDGVSEGRGDDRLEEDGSSDSDTDPCSDLPELMEAVWTLQDHEKFKAQEMERHQVQLTMYRRLALIRWVRALQGRVQEQQNRLQSSFDVILTHRKELLRVGVSAAPPPAAVGQS
ncbi:UPF0500 protein C1orf216-like [Arapaima gigas]